MNNQELTQRVRTLVEEVNETHRYSTSRIYGLYNEVFNKSETAQSCASCLIRKVKELQTWLDTQPQEQEPIVEEDEIKPTEEPQPKEIKRRKRKNGSTEA